jgi:hypothetical protein
MSKAICTTASNEHEQHRMTPVSTITHSFLRKTHRVFNCLYRCHSMLIVLIRSRVTCVFTHEWVCNCLYRSHSMLFVLVRIRVTCVVTHEQTYVPRLLTSTNNIVWHLNRKLHTRSWIKTHVTWFLTSTNNIEWHLYRQLHTRAWVKWAVVQMFLFMNECVIVYTGVILCCSCSLGAKLHVSLFMNECVIVYSGVHE